MMLCHTWAAEPESFLNFAYAHGTTPLQKKPIDLPSLSPELILELRFVLCRQKQTPF
jgi:hypothetical protein